MPSREASRPAKPADSARGYLARSGEPNRKVTTSEAG
jgi:hypothetical protein